ncbi:FkbM family methyltransferase [Patescibacteria group bacterium]
MFSYYFKKLFSFIYKSICDPKYFLGYYELHKISKIPRFKKGHTNLLGNDLIFADSASFIATYKEIFKKEIYKFKSRSTHPYIIDCGANIGLSIIYFKKLYPEAKITAFEPDKTIFEILKYNIRSFNLNDVEIIPKGLSNEESRQNFFSEGADGGRIALPEDKDNIIEIKTIPLIHYLQKPVDMLKIDIEGAEYAVIENCKNYLYNVSHLFIEYHSFINKSQNLDEILKILSINGFRYYIDYSGGALSSPFIQRKNNLGMDLQLNIFAYKK